MRSTEITAAATTSAQVLVRVGGTDVLHEIIPRGARAFDALPRPHLLERVGDDADAAREAEQTLRGGGWKTNFAISPARAQTHSGACASQTSPLSRQAESRAAADGV